MRAGTAISGAARLIVRDAPDLTGNSMDPSLSMAAATCAAVTGSLDSCAGAAPRPRGGVCCAATVAHSNPAIRQPAAQRSIGPSVHSLERKLQVGLFVAREGNRIGAGVAGRAVRALLMTDCRTQTVQAQIGEAVRFDVLADLFERVRGSDELG